MRKFNRWLFVLILIGWPANSLAHGSGTPQLVNHAAGPYLLSVWSLPEPLRVGEAHLSVAVRTPADDLVVQLRLTPIEPAGNPLIQTTVIQDRLLQRYYEADLVLPRAGEWAATVIVNGAAGEGRTDFTFTVLPPTRVNWTLLSWIVLAFVGLIGASWARRGPAE